MHRHGAWLPADHRVHKQWLGHQVKATADNPKKLIPVLQEFKDFIEGDTRMYMYFTAMFEEIPHKHPYNKVSETRPHRCISDWVDAGQDPSGHRQIRDYKHMLSVLNHIFSRAPVWTDTAAGVGVVGVPICALLGNYLQITDRSLRNNI